MTNKLCQDCKHFTPDTAGWSSPISQQQFAKCGRTAMVIPVSGTACNTERGMPWFFFGHCGKKARFFEAKEAPCVYGVMTDGSTRRSMANIKADIELKSGAPLYATKEPS